MIEAAGDGKTVLDAIPCFRCGNDIVFDPQIVGRSGKAVPLDVVTHKPHVCRAAGAGWNVSRTK